MEPIRVLLANHQPIVRNGLRCLLQRDAKIQVRAEAANGNEAIALAQFQRPDVAILDVKLDSVRGIDAARTLCAKEPATKIIILGTVVDEGYVQEAFAAGARGYVLSDFAQPDLLRAVFAVAAGRFFLSSAAGVSYLDHPGQGRGSQLLDKRQRRLFLLLCDGRPLHEIAAVLRSSDDQVVAECRALTRLLERLGISDALSAYRTR